MKILYAAANRPGSYHQMKRFLDSVQNQNHEIKLAAYKSSMGELDVDYNLDSLLNFTNPDVGISFNGNYVYYGNEIKRFNPDLIISDLELYSSILGLESGIKVWQFSPVLLYNAIGSDIKYKLGIHKNYSHLLDADHRRNSYATYVIKNSDRRLIPSHLCDSENNSIIGSEFEWVRPNFILADDSKEINYTVVMQGPNKKIINDLKDKDAVLFSEFSKETYDKLLSLDIDSIEYKSYIENCKFYICDGSEVFLADAFYNQKFSTVFPRYDDIESLTCSMINEYFGFGKVSTGEFYSGEPGKILINDNVKFISEYLGE